MELKPCPFCGSKAKFVIAPFDCSIRIECEECRSETTYRAKFDETMWECHERAKKAWNRRVGEGKKE